MIARSRARPYVIPTEPAPGSRRESRKARIRRDLVAAAVDLFSRNGFEATTVEDIASAAKVSPRTFFRYFATKEEVLFHRKDQELRDLEASLAARPADEPPLQSLRAAVTAYLRTFQAEREFHMLRIAIMAGSHSAQGYAMQLLHDWAMVLAGVLARRMQVHPYKDLRPALLAGCGIMVMRSVLFPWTHSGGTLDMGTLAEQAFDQLEKGFRS